MATKVLTGQGYNKVVYHILKGTIVAFYGARVPTGWAICDGANGTPDLTDRVVLGRTGAADSAAGTVSPAAITHSGFALANHSNHTPTQPANHANHIPGNMASHATHVFTNAGVHNIHSNVGDHAHDNHPQQANGSIAVTGTKLMGPLTHAAQGNHTHGIDDHPHSGGALDAHGGHSGFNVDAHSVHTGFAVDAHSVHSVTQADTHQFKVLKLAYIMKL